MKAIAISLITVISFLAFKPGVDMVFSCHDEIACCIDKCEPFTKDQQKQGEQSEGCEGNACNPFLSCNINVISLISSEMVHIEPPTIQQDQNYSTSSLLLSAFATEFWQPPRIA